MINVKLSYAIFNYCPIPCGRKGIADRLVGIVGSIADTLAGRMFTP